MKTGLAFCILAATYACLHAAPLQTSWHDILSATTLDKGEVGDIWKNCGRDSDRAKIDSVTISPDPPVKGQDVTVEATVTLDGPVTAGTVKVSLKWGFIPLPSQSFDLCDLLEEAGDSCPVEQGQLSIKQTLEVSGSIPGGTYKATVVATDQDKAQLLCIEITLKL